MNELRGLDAAAVADWMVANVAGCAAPIEFALIAGGHSNLTYGATDGEGNRYVVRRGPLGRSDGGAHDMGREHRVISALHGSIPVPRPLALCDDEAINDGSFYVMSRVDGVVLDNQAAADTQLPDLAARRRAGEQLVDVMADMHRVDVDAVGLGEAARRDEFLARQLKRFTGMWERNQTRELAAMTTLAGQLRELAPPQRYTGIVHGDYRIGNVMHDTRAATGGTLVAVLDWELWTLGDVLADLGFLLNNWYEPDDPNPLVFMEWPPTVTGDFGSRAEAIERYAVRTGFDVSAVDYYRGFQHWRMAVLAEGVKRRYETAQMANADVDFGHLDRRVLDLVDLAARHIDAYRLSR
jgi:aminoglycoside phosphotransferase (APT) family kinase protein